MNTLSTTSTRLLLLLTLTFAFSPLTESALAQVLVDHQAEAGQDRFVLTPSLHFSEIEYDVDGGGSGDIERRILGLSAGYGLIPDVDIYGELGYIAEAELENASGDGDGFLVGAGAKGVLLRQDTFTLHALLGARAIREDYGSGIDGSLFEVHGLLMARGQLSPAFGIYGGIELVPLSDGEIEPRRGRDTDYERDDRIGLRAGADYTFDSGLRLNAEVAGLSEQAFLLRASIPLS